MSTSITVRRYLDKHDVRYATAAYSCDTASVFQAGEENIEAQQIAKAVILKDLRGLMMAVLPGPNDLNIEALNRQLHRNLQPAEPIDYQSVFADCTPGIIPPLGEAYGFETVVDDGLLDQDLIYFVSGNNNELVRISGYDFQLLQSNAWFGNTFSNMVTAPGEDIDLQPEAGGSGNGDIRSRINNDIRIPKMPRLAQRLIQLNTNPYAKAEDLASIIEEDPAFSQQVTQYAQSAIYGSNTGVASVRQTIAHALGYDMTMYIALGIAATRPFKNIPHGPLDQHAFWRHATYSATLIHGLCNAMPAKMKPISGLACLSGLLHNIGYLVLGHLFPKEFTQLNDAMVESPDTPIVQLEQELFGLDHTELGCTLLDEWNMPQELITAVSEHHNEDYQGTHNSYVNLVYLSDCMLKQHDIGDGQNTELSDALLQKLGLSKAKIMLILERTMQGGEVLDNTARQLAA